MTSNIRLVSCKTPTCDTFSSYMLSDPEVTDDTVDTLRALHVASKTSECVFINVCRTEYMTILCDSSP